jgi:hypothetical protein
MIIKGGSRAAPRQLARHLLRADTNERVEVLELQSPTGDLNEALRDWQCLADGTRGTKGLYHANIDPDGRYTMTPEQWQRSVDALEKELGLTGQPRAVVMHEKHGREHIHVVWQRTDIDTMTLVPDSFNYLAHERASLALEQEFGHEHVPGKHAKRDREKQPDMPRAEFNHAEWQQGERAGLDPRERKEAITKLYEQSDSGAALKAALEEQGYLLAKGDRRDFVIVDRDGAIHSLGRQIEGIKAKDLREFMADIDREKLPTPEEARALQSQQQLPPEPAPPASDKFALSAEETAAIERAVADRHAEESRKQLSIQTSERRQTAAILDQDIIEKLGHFDALQQAERDRYIRENKVDRTGVAGVFMTLKEVFRPELAAEEARQRTEAADAFDGRLESERSAYIETINAEKARDLADLEERHAQQRREHTARRDEDLARYLRDEAEAKRLAAELQERQREMEEQRSRDGPDGPKRAR